VFPYFDLIEMLLCLTNTKLMVRLSKILGTKNVSNAPSPKMKHALFLDLILVRNKG
jgi:hypothetical protein